jgi:hypothetical protein
VKIGRAQGLEPPELGAEALLVVEAAQVEEECPVADAADDGRRQVAEARGQRLEAGAGADRRSERRGEAAGRRRDRGPRAHEMPQRRQGLRQPVRIAVELKVASSAASRMSSRTARLIGFLAARATSSRAPATMPACGRPNSLSPEKTTRSAPSASASRTVGSGRRP